MTAVIGPLNQILEFRLPCIYKTMTSLPVTIGLIYNCQLSTGNKNIDRSKSHVMISEFGFRTITTEESLRTHRKDQKNAEFQISDR